MVLIKYKVALATVQNKKIKIILQEKYFLQIPISLTLRKMCIYADNEKKYYYNPRDILLHAIVTVIVQLIVRCLCEK